MVKPQPWTSPVRRVSHIIPSPQERHKWLPLASRAAGLPVPDDETGIVRKSRGEGEGLSPSEIANPPEPRVLERTEIIDTSEVLDDELAVRCIGGMYVAVLLD